MGNPRIILRYLTALPTLLVFTTAYAGEAQPVSPRTEPITKESAVYQAGDQSAIEALSLEIRALRDELHKMQESEDVRLRRIEQALSLKSAKKTETSQPAQMPTKQPGDAKVISVCSQGCDFSNLQQAVNAAPTGGEVRLAPEINGTCAIIRKPVHIVGEQSADGRRAHLVGGVCGGKGALVTAAPNIVIEGLEISDISVGDGNGACVRLSRGTRDLTVRNIYCHDSQDGILGASDGHLLIEDSVFIGNGFGNGRAHGLYLNGGGDVLIRRCRILSSQNAGHLLKSGARKLTVEDSVLAALNGRNSRVLDAFAGGEIVLRRNILQQGPQSDNSDLIGLALESRLHPDGHSFRMDDNWVISDRPGRSVLIRGRKLGPVAILNNNFVGLDKLGLDGADESGNHWFAKRNEAGLPPFDGTLASLPGKSAPE
ncbi:right-handed parallel beta-helix repeat-containing protein [Methylomonas methanica]|nr:right-handed parallel beta-helix repeat-containing protein [Methylomonas methanica]